MNKKNFNLLLGSMREGAQILRGEREPSRRFEHATQLGTGTPTPNRHCTRASHDRPAPTGTVPINR